MDTMSISRLTNNGKASKFNRTASDNNILHTTKWKNKIHSRSNQNCFVFPNGKQPTSPSRNCDSQNIFEISNPGSDSNVSDEGKPCSTQFDQLSWRKMPRASIDNEILNKRCVVNNAFEIQVKERIKTVLESKQHEADFKNCSSDGVQNKSRCSEEPLKREMLTHFHVCVDTKNNKLSDVTDEELEKLPDLNCLTKNVYNEKSKAPHSVFTVSSSGIDNNGLTDVRDEELEGLPDLQTPSCTIPQKRSPKIDQNLTQQKYTPERTMVNKNKRIHQLKRSVSSLESDDDFTSFFGSIKNRNKRNIDEEMYSDEPFYFNTSMSVVPGHTDTAFEKPGLTINRAYSAESFMKRKEARNSIYSRHSSRKNSCLEEGDNQTESVSGRLHIRRGALAEPEKMLISQELRERTQRGVEKRKTFLRKVSQFFNLHLRLNLEEDLI